MSQWVSLFYLKTESRQFLNTTMTVIMTLTQNKGPTAKDSKIMMLEQFCKYMIKLSTYWMLFSPPFILQFLEKRYNEVKFLNQMTSIFLNTRKDAKNANWTFLQKSAILLSTKEGGERDVFPKESVFLFHGIKLLYEICCVKRSALWKNSTEIENFWANLQKNN